MKALRIRNILRPGGLASRIMVDAHVQCRRLATIGSGLDGGIADFNKEFSDVFGSPDDSSSSAATQQLPIPLQPGDDVASRRHAAGESHPRDLTHVDSRGKAAMVDIGGKATTLRIATASGRVLLGHDAFKAVSENSIAKGDVLSVARVAGILAAKQTGQLIPLCHTLHLNKIQVNFQLMPQQSAVRIRSEAHTWGQTGVEMEALTAVSVAALTIYDMCKALFKGIVITDIRLESKMGGQSGKFRRGVGPLRNSNDKNL